MEQLSETAGQVAAEIPRFSWLLMDEEQRDDLMENVVLPRYMKTTVDGVQLGPTWWAEAVGATMSAIENRVRRLRKAQDSEGVESSRSGPTSTQRASVRSARSAIRKHPELARELLADEEVASSVVADRDTRRRLDEARERAAGEDIAIRNLTDDVDDEVLREGGVERTNALIRRHITHAVVNGSSAVRLSTEVALNDATKRALTDGARAFEALAGNMRDLAAGAEDIEVAAAAWSGGSLDEGL